MQQNEVWEHMQPEDWDGQSVSKHFHQQTADALGRNLAERSQLFHEPRSVHRSYLIEHRLPLFSLKG